MKSKLIYITGIIFFILIIIYSYASNVNEYVLDSVISIVTITLIFLIRKHINLTNISFFLLILALLFHDFGVFGFYNKTPILIQYDHFTHFFGLFAVSILIFNIFKQFFKKSKITNLILILFVFISSLGIGSLIEQTEYLGYLRFGTGQGLLKFGGLGDTPFDDKNLRAMDIIGGGWINTMLDLNYNFLGALIGTITMYLINKFKSKNYFENKDGKA